MNVSKIMLLLICILGCLSADDPILVKLETEAKLQPISISKFATSESAFDANYLKDLEKVLRFDLNHNGMTAVVDLKKTKSRAFDLEVAAVDQSLKAQVLDRATHTLKTIDTMRLSGDLRFDRRQIHLLADAIFEALFDQKGVASTRILYTVKTQGKTTNTSLSEVFESDYDGGNARQVTREGGYCVTPCYLPSKPGLSSANFFYVSYKNGQPKIYIASLKDGTSRRFSYMRGNQLLPAVSLQRDKVAFINDITGNPDLFLQPFNPDVGPMGKPQQIFAAAKATQGSPTFSPDGKKIAFVSNKDGAPRVYAMTIPAPGTNLKQVKPKLITKVNKESSAPAWSPDGKKIAYCSMTNGARQIWIYDFDKDEEWQLTYGSENKENPSWAPNSLHLIFNSTGKSGSELYLVNLNQPEAIKITNGPGEKRFPNWEPIQ